MLALGLLLVVPVLMWCGQAVLLRRAGLPLRWRISSSGLPRGAHRINRICTNAAFLVVLLAYPLLRGQSPSAYYGGFFPRGAGFATAAHGFALATAYLGGLYVAWLLTDNVRARTPRTLGRAAAHFAGLPLSTVLGALMEELLFRALLMAGLAESFGMPAAMVGGTLAFAIGHYVRRVKRYWTFPGHLGLGAMLCTAYACTGALWLPIGVHAGGIFVIMGVRPFVRYVGPSWLVGASIFPYAGITGLIGLTLLTTNIVLTYGGRG